VALSGTAHQSPAAAAHFHDTAGGAGAIHYNGTITRSGALDANGTGGVDKSIVLGADLSGGSVHVDCNRARANFRAARRQYTAQPVQLILKDNNLSGLRPALR